LDQPNHSHEVYNAGTDTQIRSIEADRDIPIWREELDEVEKVVQNLQVDLSKKVESKHSDALADEKNY
jgi:hypothetical protein